MAVAAAVAMLERAWSASYAVLIGLHPVHVLTVVILAAGVAMVWRVRRPQDVYLVEYACFLGEPCHRVPFAMALEHAHHMTNLIEEESTKFMVRLHERSGIGEETSVPDSFRYIPPDRSIEAAREEAELVIFSAIDKVFAETTTLKPEDIDTVIVACSFTTLTPVFADVVVNRYRLRAHVQSVNLSGMGCSGALICIGLAKNLLQVAPLGKHVLIVATEILSSMFYMGTKREMLVPNVLFRMGAAAMIMSNSPERARFRLGPIVRTLTAAQDSDYRCAFQEEDDKGITGINLSKELPVVAANALKGHIMAFGPAVLPVSELVRVAVSILKHKFLAANGKKVYRPAFNKVFQHFCIHPGGRRVLYEVQRGLGLTDGNMEASHMTLHRFGNMASSSLLYELAYIEAKRQMRKGDRVCMISFSPGIDCSSVAWECIKPAADPINGPWAGCIHRYPVQLPQIVKRA